MGRRKGLEPRTVIELEEWDGWRIVGNGESWQIQQRDGSAWKPRQTFPTLLAAALAAYDYAVSGAGFEVRSARDLCEVCELMAGRMRDAFKGAGVI